MANFNVSYIFRAIDQFSGTAKKISGELTVMDTRVVTLRKRFASFGSAMTAAGKKMSLLVTLPIIGAGYAAVHAAGSFEQMRVQFHSMYGSAAKARKEMHYLAQFSAKTPFRLANVVGADQILQNMGMSAKEAHGELKQLGDFTANQPQNLNYLASLVGRARTRGVVHMRQLRAFTLLRIPIVGVLKDMAAKAGHPNADVYKAASHGMITYAIFKKAMDTLTSKGGQYYEHMMMQSKSLFGLLSTFKDAFYVNFLVPMGDIIMDTLGLKKHFANINEMLLSMDGKMAKWAAAHKRLTKLIVYAGLALAVIGPILIVLGLLANGFAVAMGIVAGISSVVAGIFSVILSPIILIVAAVIAIGVVFYELYKHCKAFREVVQEAWVWLKAIWKVAKLQLAPVFEFMWKLVKFSLITAFEVLKYTIIAIGKIFYYTLIVPLREAVKLLTYLDRPLKPVGVKGWGLHKQKPVTLAQQQAGYNTMFGQGGMAPQQHHLQISIKDPGNNVANTKAKSGLGMSMGLNVGANMAHAR